MSFSASAADERVLDVQSSDDTLSVSLRDGRIITVPLVWYPRLLDATPAQRKNWRIAGGGYGLHWPDLRRRPQHRGIVARRARAESSLDFFELSEQVVDCGLAIHSGVPLAIYPKADDSVRH